MIRVRTEVLSVLDRTMRRIGIMLRVPHAIVLNVTPDSQDKLDLLRASNSTRDFQKITPTLRTAIETGFTREAKRLLAGTSTDFDAPWREVGLVTARFMRNRIEDGHGGDVKMAPLKPSTINTKRAQRMARPTAIGYATGKLYRDIARVASSKDIKVVR